VPREDKKRGKKIIKRETTPWPGIEPGQLYDRGFLNYNFEKRPKEKKGEREREDKKIRTWEVRSQCILRPK
jgi:hypothetical protein